MIAVIGGLSQVKYCTNVTFYFVKYPYVIIPFMRALITVDVGGTSMRAASYPHVDNIPIIYKKIPTVAFQEVVFERLCNLIRSVWPEKTEIDGICVATAGPVNPKTGLVFEAPNIPGWNNIPLENKLQNEFNVPVFIGNDANLAALGEWKYGSGIGHQDLIYLTISTGIGGGVITSGHLLLGENGLAAELGHIPVILDGPVCSCGKKGHLEAVSSGPAIVNYYNQLLQATNSSSRKSKPLNTAQEIADLAQNGDERAKQSYSRSGRYLGMALAGFIHIFNPSIIIFGGGVSQSGSILFDPMMNSLRTEVMDPIYLKKIEFKLAHLSDNAGLLGALVLLKQNLNIL